MKTLVDLYPDLFDVRPSAFFANGELHISPVVKASIPQLEVKAKDYAMEPGGLVPVLIEPPLCGSFCVMRFATKSREEIWFFVRFALSLRLCLEDTLARKYPNKFGIFLAYSYLCTLKYN